MLPVHQEHLVFSRQVNCSMAEILSVLLKEILVLYGKKELLFLFEKGRLLAEGSVPYPHKDHLLLPDKNHAVWWSDLRCSDFLCATLLAHSNNIFYVPILFPTDFLTVSDKQNN